MAEAMIGDVTDADFRQKTFDLMCSKYGPPAVCVPAAGITRDQLAVKMDKQTGKAVDLPDRELPAGDGGQPGRPRLLGDRDDRPDRRAAVKARARDAGPPRKGIQGTIIFIGSISSSGIPGQVSYSATKAALEGAAATLCKEAIYHGVRFATIHPGFTDTPMVRHWGRSTSRRTFFPYTQLKRLIDPAEIADAIYFMICNSAVSGELWADAGWHPPA